LIRRACMCWTIRASTFRCAGRSTSRGRCRAGRSSSRRARRRRGGKLAAETAEVIFAAHADLEAGQRFLADVKGRAQKLGRSRDDIRSCLAPSSSSATASRGAGQASELDSLVYYESGIASLSIAIGHDAAGFDPDAALPKIPETNASKSGRERVIELARNEKPTVRQLAQRLGGYFRPRLCRHAEDHCR